MCGSGTNCAVRETPATEHGRAHEQEALELRYGRSRPTRRENVTLLMPPSSAQPGSGGDIASAANSSDFPSLIGKPLSTLFPSAGPYTEATGGATELASGIDLIVGPSLYA